MSGKGKGIAWVENERVPTGSTPPAPVNPENESSSDEEYEGFLQPATLLLSGANKLTTRDTVERFFEGFNCKVATREKQKDGTMTYVVEFGSTKLANDALKQYKGVPLGEGKKWMHDVTLTRYVYAKYKSFCITNFNQKLDRDGISNQVRKDFSKFGKILHFFFGTDEGNCVYLYMELKPEYVEKKISVWGLKVRECHIKGKETKKLSSNWE